MEKKVRPPADSQENTTPDRRSFFGMALFGAGSIATLAAAVGSFVSGLVQPIRPARPDKMEKAQSDESDAAGKSDEYLFVTRLESLPENGQAARFPVIANPVDAWTRHQSRSIGNVYLRRTDSENGILAWNARCPHAGCTIDFRSEKNDFFCHCHESQFRSDGSLPEGRTHSPRAMDSLETEIRNSNEIWIRFQQFQVGTSDKRPIS